MKVIDLAKHSLNPWIVHNPALPVNYVRNAYYNGIGRYVCQLQRITLKFCKTSVCSAGVREFIETEMIDWSRQNPGVVVYLKPRRHRSPVIVTEYLNGQNHWMSAKKFGKVEIMWWLDFLRTRSGYEISQLLSPVNSSLPSIQGPWNPFLNRPTNLNISQFPNAERSDYIYDQPSATQQLIEISKSMNLTDDESENK